MKYINSCIKALFWPVLFWIGQFIITLILAFLFQAEKYKQFASIYKNSTREYLEKVMNHFLTSNDFMLEFSTYMKEHLYIVLLINTLLFIPLFLYFYKIKYKNQKVLKRNYIESIFASLSLGIFLNFLLQREILKEYEFSLLGTLSIGIIGPILEELVFRGLFYRKMRSCFSRNFSIIFVTILFAIFHGTISQIVYAFCMGLLFIYLYEKNDSILVPIISHITINLTIELFFPIIMYTSIFAKFFFCTICFIYFIIFIYRQRQYVR